MLFLEMSTLIMIIITIIIITYHNSYWSPILSDPAYVPPPLGSFPQLPLRCFFFSWKVLSKWKQSFQFYATPVPCASLCHCAPRSSVVSFFHTSLPWYCLIILQARVPVISHPVSRTGAASGTTQVLRTIWNGFLRITGAGSLDVRPQLCIVF